jgi:hypothetical protein
VTPVFAALNDHPIGQLYCAAQQLCQGFQKAKKLPFDGPGAVD